MSNEKTVPPPCDGWTFTREDDQGLVAKYTGPSDHDPRAHVHRGSLCLHEASQVPLSVVRVLLADQPLAPAPAAEVTERRPCGAWQATGDGFALRLGFDTVTVRPDMSGRAWWIGTNALTSLSSLTDYDTPEAGMLAAEDAAATLLRGALKALGGGRDV